MRSRDETPQRILIGEKRPGGKSKLQTPELQGSLLFLLDPQLNWLSRNDSVGLGSARALACCGRRPRRPHRTLEFPLFSESLRPMAGARAPRPTRGARVLPKFLLHRDG